MNYGYQFCGQQKETYKYLSCERDANAFSSIIIILLWSRYLEEGKEIHEHEIISYLFMLCVFSAKQKATVIIGLWKSLWLVIAARALNKVKLLVVRLIHFKNESQHVGCILHIRFFFYTKRLAVCNRNVVIHITWQTSKIHHITLIHIAFGKKGSVHKKKFLY